MGDKKDFIVTCVAGDGKDLEEVLNNPPLGYRVFKILPAFTDILSGRAWYSYRVVFKSFTAPPA